MLSSGILPSRVLSSRILASGSLSGWARVRLVALGPARLRAIGVLSWSARRSTILLGAILLSTRLRRALRLLPLRPRRLLTLPQLADFF